jgi:PKD repeat protein
VGGNSDLTWSVHNASTITLDALGNVAAISGTTVAPTSTTTYKLTATNIAGSQSATLTVRVDSTLSVSIRGDRITGTTPLAVNFTILLSGGVPPYRYQWSFGDTSVQPTHTWTTAAAEDVTCTVTDSHGTVQKSNALRIIASTKNAGIDLGFFDQASNNLPTDPYRRIGASADGVTTVEVRATTTASGNVTFKFDGRVGRGLDGGLFPTLDALGSGTASLTVRNKPLGSQFVASAYYQVPEDFNGATDDQFQRVFHFSAHLGDNGAVADIDNVEFHLRRTPVVFVHGIWSSILTWNDFPLATQLVAQGDATLAAWDGRSSISSSATQVRPYFDLALHVLRKQGIAVKRVDVVAHSMGGLIARHIASADHTIMHKLITIDTPHFGSALADYVVANKNNFFIWGYFLPGHPIDTGAADDLRVAVGAGARQADTPGLRAHSIVGVASNDEQCKATDNNPLPSLVTALCVADDPLDFANCKRSLLTSILSNRPNDEIVDIDSQRGGLGATSQFDSGAFTGQHICLAAHLNITSDFSGDVSRRIKALLNQSATTGEFSAYSLPQTHFANGMMDTQVQNTPAVSLIRPRPSATESVSIVTPLDGQSVTPGSSIEVAIAAPVTFTSAFVATPDQITATSAQPFQARIDIPATAIGQYAISVRADTGAGDSATASITLNVVPNASVASLIVQPLELFLNVGDTLKPFVRGVFTDGVTRDLSRSAAVAVVSSDPAIVSVLADGSLKAIGFGSARVTVFSGAASAEILINVESVGRKRVVNH